MNIVKSDKNKNLTAIEVRMRRIASLLVRRLTFCQSFVRGEMQNSLVRNAEGHALVEHFEEQFSAENFLSCFIAMKDYLDVNASSNKGKWFMKSESRRRRI